MDPAPGFMIEGTKASQINDLLKVVGRNNEFISVVETLKTYEQDVKQISAAIQQTVSSGTNNSKSVSSYGVSGGATATQNEISKEAAIAAKYVDVKKNVSADLVFAQWALESGNFNSRLAKENRNLGGLTQPNSNGEENKQPDGNCYYKVYSSVKEYGEDYIKSFLNFYPEVGKVRISDAATFARILKHHSYYGADEGEYTAGIITWMGNWERIYNAAIAEQKGTSTKDSKDTKNDDNKNTSKNNTSSTNTNNTSNNNNKTDTNNKTETKK